MFIEFDVEELCSSTATKPHVEKSTEKRFIF